MPPPAGRQRGRPVVTQMPWSVQSKVARRVIVLRLPRFGSRYVWLTVSRHDPEELLQRYRRSQTPVGVTVTAGGGEVAHDLWDHGTEPRSRRQVEEQADRVGVELALAGHKVLSDAPRMARIRRSVEGACP